MRITTVKCSCDYCGRNISEYEYNECIRVTLRADIPDPKGRSGDCNGTTLVLCDKCAENIGFVKEDIHNGFMGTRERILKALEDNKNKILQMFIKG